MDEHAFGRVAHALGRWQTNGSSSDSPTRCVESALALVVLALSLLVPTCAIAVALVRCACAAHEPNEVKGALGAPAATEPDGSSDDSDADE